MQFQSISIRIQLDIFIFIFSLTILILNLSWTWIKKYYSKLNFGQTCVRDSVTQVYKATKFSIYI